MPESEQLDQSSYDVLRGRLDAQGKVLRERLETLNAKRKEAFGSVELRPCRHLPCLDRARLHPAGHRGRRRPRADGVQRSLRAQEQHRPRRRLRRLPPGRHRRLPRRKPEPPRERVLPEGLHRPHALLQRRALRQVLPPRPARLHEVPDGPDCRRLQGLQVGGAGRRLGLPRQPRRPRGHLSAPARLRVAPRHPRHADRREVPALLHRRPGLRGDHRRRPDDQGREQHRDRRGHSRGTRRRAGPGPRRRRRAVRDRGSAGPAPHPALPREGLAALRLQHQARHRRARRRAGRRRRAAARGPGRDDRRRRVPRHGREAGLRRRRRPRRRARRPHLRPPRGQPQRRGLPLRLLPAGAGRLRAVLVQPDRPAGGGAHRVQRLREPRRRPAAAVQVARWSGAPEAPRGAELDHALRRARLRPAGRCRGRRREPAQADRQPRRGAGDGRGPPGAGARLAGGPVPVAVRGPRQAGERPARHLFLARRGRRRAGRRAARGHPRRGGGGGRRVREADPAEARDGAGRVRGPLRGRRRHRHRPRRQPRRGRRLRRDARRAAGGPREGHRPAGAAPRRPGRGRGDGGLGGRADRSRLTEDAHVPPPRRRAGPVPQQGAGAGRRRRRGGEGGRSGGAGGSRRCVGGRAGAAHRRGQQPRHRRRHAADRRRRVDLRGLLPAQCHALPAAGPPAGAGPAGGRGRVRFSPEAAGAEHHQRAGAGRHAREGRRLAREADGAGGGAGGRLRRLRRLRRRAHREARGGARRLRATPPRARRAEEPAGRHARPGRRADPRHRPFPRRGHGLRRGDQRLLRRRPDGREAPRPRRRAGGDGRPGARGRPAVGAEGGEGGRRPAAEGPSGPAGRRPRHDPLRPARLRDQHAADRPDARPPRRRPGAARHRDAVL